MGFGSAGRALRFTSERSSYKPAETSAVGRREPATVCPFGWAAAKKCATALRMLLRFLIAEGRPPAAWMGRSADDVGRRTGDISHTKSANDGTRTSCSSALVRRFVRSAHILLCR